MPTLIGHVTQERYEQIVTRAREPAELRTRSPFQLGDLALEREPIQPSPPRRGRRHRAFPLL
ncbi:hypothetical protein [Nonomuraea sp. NPDC050691]|uniref:hypothetical protein n=1 Tax=Nonomuraea sp. NPDC050691 TaxID=3155661 RepID=UPI0033F37444